MIDAQSRSEKMNTFNLTKGDARPGVPIKEGAIIKGLLHCPFGMTRLEVGEKKGMSPHETED